jgi:ribosomal protein L11 methyltransferase
VVRRYAQLTVELAEAEADLAQLALHEAGALGLEVRDAQTLAMPGVRAPAGGQTLLIGSYATAQGARGAAAHVRRAFPDARVSWRSVPPTDWSKHWRARVRATRVGRLWVGPPWLAARAPRSATRIVVEPKMAFGTGDHPTTGLCLEAVDSFVARHPHCTVLDVGTGTGVLAIAARKLGARRVRGIDNDPVAVTLAQECARDNDAAVELSTAPLRAVRGRFDLVLANILANTLIELAPHLVRRVGERLVLAGVLVPQAAEVERAFIRQGLRPLGRASRGEWVRLDFGRGA